MTTNAHIDRMPDADSFESPESELVARASYDYGSQVLEIVLKLKGGEKTFLTTGVPKTMWEEFRDSQSKGGFFNRYIRTMYLLHPKE